MLLFALLAQTALMAYASPSEHTPTGEQIVSSHQNSGSTQGKVDLYTLHHRIFPNLLFESDGMFFSKLYDGEFQRFRQAIARVAGESYAADLSFKKLDKPEVILISFPHPQKPPLCYHVALMRNGATLRYLTLEYTEDLLSRGIQSVLGEWLSDHTHLNHGPRFYSSLEKFESEIRTLMSDQSTPKSETLMQE